MAKKKTEDVETKFDLNNYREQLRKDIIKKYGDGISKEMGDLRSEKKIIIPISPAIDRGLNGGVPEGSWVTLAGPPKFGKTTLALQLAANAQKPEYGSKTVYYLDIEGRFKNMNLTSVASFNPDMCEHIRSQKGKILSAEEYLTIATDIIKGHPGCVIILDSSSALCAATEIAADITASYRNEGPKLLAAFTRKMANVVPINDTIVVVIQHIIANTGYGGGTMEDGGNKIKYQVDVKLRGKYTEKWTDSTGEHQIGQLAHWEVLSSALGPPNSKIKNYVRYGYGIDETMELIEMATDFGIIDKAGSWYRFDLNGEEVKAQGMEKLCTLLRDNKDYYNFISNGVNLV